jgi:thiol-disulfide isomerase/thioredoxin
MKARIFCLAATFLALVAFQARAQTLAVGDDAPAIEVSRWAKGEKVERLEKDRSYVVEFWATWCGPCRVSIPHLTELQKKHKDIRFIGVAVWEQDQKKVAPFVESMGDKMDYSVALDDVPAGQNGNTGKMAKGWMTASGSNGIPTAFIVKNGKIAWIGHPMMMEQPLEKVISPTFDLSKAADEYRAEKGKELKLAAVQQKLQKLGFFATVKSRIEVMDQAIEETPELESLLGLQKYMLLFRSKDKAATEYGNKLVEGALKDEGQSLNEIAWMNIDPASKIPDADRDVKLALKAATRANELTKGESGAILDTLALAYFKTGEPAKALEAQEKAIKLMGDSDAGMKDRLEQYRKAVGEPKP